MNKTIHLVSFWGEPPYKYALHLEFHGSHLLWFSLWKLYAMRVLHCVCGRVWLYVSQRWALRGQLVCYFVNEVLYFYVQEKIMCTHLLCYSVCVCVSLSTLSTVAHLLAVFVSTYISSIHPLLGNTWVRCGAVSLYSIRWLSVWLWQPRFMRSDLMVWIKPLGEAQSCCSQSEQMFEGLLVHCRQTRSYQRCNAVLGHRH